jgi:hypothetical protein
MLFVMAGKEILVLAGSPRINGNSDMLADAFIEGAKKAGHSVTKIYAAAHKVNGCLGCNKCWSDGIIASRRMIWLNCTLHLKGDCAGICDPALLLQLVGAALNVCWTEPLHMPATIENRHGR